MKIRLLACGIALSAAAADQPQWGAAWSRNMVSTETGLADRFNPATGENTLWRAALGTESHATPVVANGRVYIGTNNERPRDPRHAGDRGIELCLDEKDGHLHWQLVSPKLTNSIYWDWPKAGICSPPSVEGDRVYLVGNRGEILCLDAAGMANGNDGPFTNEAQHATPAGGTTVETIATDADILWIFDLIAECGVRQHDSAHASILIRGDHLYVNTSNGVDDSHKRIEAPDAPSLVVLDKRTGKLVTRDRLGIGPDIFHSTWSPPSLGKLGDREAVFFCGGNGVIHAFAPAQDSGSTLNSLWRFDFDPAAPKTNIHAFLSNRKESPSVIHSLPVYDGGRLFISGGGDLWWGKREAWLKCIATTGEGDVTATALRWSYPLTRHVMSSPAVAGGLVYVADCGGRVHCVDAGTGANVWTHETKGEFWASPLVADGKVFIGSRRGEFLIFKAGREKTLLSTIELGEPISGTPVAANGTLYVSTAKSLYAVGGPR